MLSGLKQQQQKQKAYQPVRETKIYVEKLETQESGDNQDLKSKKENKLIKYPLCVMSLLHSKTSNRVRSFSYVPESTLDH